MKRSVTLLAWIILILSGPALRAAPAPPSGPGQVDAIVSAAVDDLWAQTDHYFHKGDYPRIIGLDRIIVQADPHFVECYATGGWLMESLGNMKDAEAFYKDGIRNNPHVSYAHYSLGFLYFNTLHDYPAAVKTYQQDVAQPDAGVLDWRMLAHSYEKTGDWTRAVATWREIKKRWPHGAPTDPTRGGVDDKNLRGALAHLQSADRLPADTGKTPTL